MTNKEIRTEMFARGIPQWKLAKMLGVSELTVWRLLRDELPEERKAEILAIIKRCEND